MANGISRRAVLAASTIPAVAALGGPPAKAAMGNDTDPDNISADAVVCGGGLSGMTAALRLKQAGLSVVVLEANDRLGGRTLTRRSDAGAALDLGAQFVGPTQTRLLSLIRELGIQTFKGYGDGDGLLHRGNGLSRLPDGQLVLQPDELEEFARVSGLINAMAAQVQTDAPERTPDAEAWDSLTVRSWIAQNVHSPIVASFMETVVTALLGCTAGEVSMLFFAYYVRQGESFEMLISTRDGAQDSRFIGGGQQFCLRIADQLDRGSVRLDAPVDRILQNTDGVVVHAGPLAIEAGFAVVAMPPCAADRVTFDPPLPVARRELQLRAPMGRYMKVIATYARPFWKERGLNGEVVNLDGYLFGVFDESEPEAGSHALLGFAAADQLIELRSLSAEERRSRILTELTGFFGESAGRPIDYVEYDWDDDHWVRGGPVMCLPPGTLSRVGRALREPVGRIHWAGTEAALEWTGYLDGAIEAGERAAENIVNASRG